MIVVNDRVDAPLEDRELLTEMVRALVDQPKFVRVQEQPYANGMGVTFLIHCAPADRGKVIGRGGATIQALVHLFSNIGAIDGRRVQIMVSDRPV